MFKDMVIPAVLILIVGILIGVFTTSDRIPDCRSDEWINPDTMQCQHVDEIVE